MTIPRRVIWAGLGFYCIGMMGRETDARIPWWRQSFVEMPWGQCDKRPLAGATPIDMMLWFRDYRNAPAFLESLSRHVYSFDARYLTQVLAILKQPDQADIVSIFGMNALKPMLSAMTYPELKERYLAVALENLECLNGLFQISGLASLKDVALYQELAARMLLYSLQSEHLLMTITQEAAAKGLAVRMFAAMGEEFSEAVLVSVRLILPEAETLFQELKRNPFFRGRTATDLALVDFLKE